MDDIIQRDYIIVLINMIYSFDFILLISTRLGESEELPEIRVDGASPGPRVTFNIQDTVRQSLFILHFIKYHAAIQTKHKQ